MNDMIQTDTVASPNGLTQDYLRSILKYDQDTGIFTWILPTKYHPRMVGKEAGSIATGYVTIKIDGKRYKAHRLAWLYVHGAMPRNWLDHKDGDTFNNAIGNLREATPAQNIANSIRYKGKELPKGIRRNGSGFTARISFNGTLITIGTFRTPEIAAAAYFSEATRLYGAFARAA